MSNILLLCNQIREAGGICLMVGGSVRDKLLNKVQKDFDFEVFNLLEEELLTVLSYCGKVDKVGESYSVFKVKIGEDIFDVSLPRTDIKTGNSHKDFEVTNNPFMTIKEAAKRRDFTINSIYYNPLTDGYFDYYNGIQDLEEKTLRFVDSETFVEDPLRALRAAQFCARFTLKPEKYTLSLIKEVSKTSLKTISKDRFQEEFFKGLVKAQDAGTFLQCLFDFGIIDSIFSELKGIFKDCYNESYTKKALSELTRNLSDLPEITDMEKFAMFLAVIMSEYAGHKDERKIVKVFLDRLNIFSQSGYDIRKMVFLLIENQYMAIGTSFSDGYYRKLALKVPLNILTVYSKSVNYILPSSHFDMFAKRAMELDVYDKSPELPLITGDYLQELGMKPSSDLGKLKEYLYNIQMEENASKAFLEEKAKYFVDKYLETGYYLDS